MMVVQVFKRMLGSVAFRRY